MVKLPIYLWIAPVFMDEAISSMNGTRKNSASEAGCVYTEKILLSKKHGRGGILVLWSPLRDIATVIKIVGWSPHQSIGETGLLMQTRCLIEYLPKR